MGAVDRRGNFRGTHVSVRTWPVCLREENWARGCKNGFEPPRSRLKNGVAKLGKLVGLSKRATTCVMHVGR